MKVNLNESKIESMRYTHDNDTHDIIVGIDGVSKIECVEQYCGEYSIHWLNVYNNNKIVARYNAARIDFIYYEEDI